ncbi:MAG: hypothetical protein N3F09_07960 [Bacteroidia bacterium]|nr:hypothetical protein [Bacteroidia bacterium]
MKYLFFLLLLSSSLLCYGQAGRKKERSNQKRRAGVNLFKGTKSAGHADAFARSHKKGFFARLFGKKSSPWVYHKTKVSRKENIQNRRLFSRQWTKRKKLYASILKRQNAYRAKRRVHGNKVFHKKKY